MFSQLIKIRIVLIACLLPLFATAQVFPHHISEDKLLGKVKQISIVTNDASREVYMYDVKGNQTERWFFQPLEVLLYRYKAVYNEKGQLLEETKFNNGVVPVIKYVYAYDGKGTPIGRSLFSENNTLLEKYVYQYDTAKRMTDSIRVDTYGNIIEKYSWSYDRMGRKTKQTWFQRQDSSTFTIEYEYNAAGKLVKEKGSSSGLKDNDHTTTYAYDEWGNKTGEKKSFWSHRAPSDKDYKYIFTYDSNKNVTSFISVKPNGQLVEKNTYVFDKIGNKVEATVYDTADKVLRQLIYRYDEKNNEIGLKSYQPQNKIGITVSSLYEYDKTGNWTRRVQFIDGTPGEVIKREIEYY
jgi:hypothetical protein